VEYLKFKVYLILCIAVHIKLIAIFNLLILYQQNIYKQLLCNRTDNMNGFLLIADVPIWTEINYFFKYVSSRICVSSWHLVCYICSV